MPYKVSIITPCYNGDKYLEEFLNSVLNQTYNNIELVFINDGSTDNTEKIAFTYQEKFKNKGIHFIYLKQKNQGAASALNLGFQNFSGDFITWPDADDILHKQNIELKVQFLKNNPNYKMVRGMRAFFSDNIKKLRKCPYNKNFKKEDIFFDLFLEKTFCNGGCYLITKELFLECYPHKKIYAGLGSQNWQILVPVASRAKCGFIEKEIFFLREHSESFSRKKRSLQEWDKRFEDHQALLYDSFKHSICDINLCTQIVEKKYIKRKFFKALEFYNIKYRIKAFKNLIKSKQVNVKSFVLLLFAWPFSLPIFKILAKFIKKIKAK